MKTNSIRVALDEEYLQSWIELKKVKSVILGMIQIFHCSCTDISNKTTKLHCILDKI